MSRLIFEARRRLAPPSARKGTITIEAPPELPRVIPPSLLRRAMPYLIVILIVGMVVALVATGMRVISPQTLFFPFVLLLAATALYRGNDNKMRTEEVDAERADYLRYLSVVRDNIRTQAAEQRAAAQWSHPDPAALASVPGSRRQWERDPHDPDFLVLRAGRHQVPLATALRVKDTADEIDLEPVSHSALRSLLDTQRTVRDVPTGIDVTKVSRITVLGDAAEVRAALRAWIAQAVTWHDPTVLGVALATRDLESRDWSWLKWLPHVDIPGQLDGVGPARYLSTDPDELVSLLGPALARPPGVHRRAGRCAAAPADRRRRPRLRPERLDAGGGPGGGHRRALLGHTAAPRTVFGSRKADPAHRATVPSSAGRPVAGSPTSTPPTNSAPTTPPTWPASCRGGTPTRPTPGCARRPPAAPPSPRCWASRTRRSWMCPRCGRRDAATTSCAFRSVSPRPASR